MNPNITPSKGASELPQTSPLAGEEKIRTSIEKLHRNKGVVKMFVVIKRILGFIPDRIPIELIVTKTLANAKHALRTKRTFLINYKPPLYEVENNSNVPKFISIPYEAKYGIVFVIEWPTPAPPDGIMPYDDFRKKFQALISNIILYPFREPLNIHYKFDKLTPEDINEYINKIKEGIEEAKRIEEQKMFAGFITPEWKNYPFLKGIVARNGQQFDDYIWYCKTKKGTKIFLYEPSRYWIIIGRNITPELFAKKLATILQNNRIQDTRTTMEARLYALKKILLRMAQIEETSKYAFVATKLLQENILRGDFE
jgi:hypothetical protein